MMMVRGCVPGPLQHGKDVSPQKRARIASLSLPFTTHRLLGQHAAQLATAQDANDGGAGQAVVAIERGCVMMES